MAKINEMSKNTLIWFSLQKLNLASEYDKVLGGLGRRLNT